MKYTVSMHPDDWPGTELEDAHRRYRSLGQALHHLKEAVILAGPTAGVYLRRAIPPAFREQIMRSPATASNNCPIWIGGLVTARSVGTRAPHLWEQISHLRRPGLDKCEPREYAALNWVHPPCYTWPRRGAGHGSSRSLPPPSHRGNRPTSRPP